MPNTEVTCVYEFVDGSWVLQTDGTTVPPGCSANFDVSISGGTSITVNCKTATIISVELKGMLPPTGGTVVNLRADANGQWLDSNGNVWNDRIASVGGKNLKAPPGAKIDLELTPGGNFKFKVIGLEMP